MDRGTGQATVCGIAKSRTQLNDYLFIIGNWNAKVGSQLIGSGHRQLLCKTHIPSSGNVETKDSVCELLLYLSILKYFFA